MYYNVGILDDNWEVSELFKIILENLEIFKVVSFDHGKSFMEYLYDEKPLDIAIIDLDLPDTTGYEVIKFLRESNYKYLPIIVITAFEDFNHKVKALEMGADDYIVKPINIFEVVLKINNYLKKKKYIEEILRRESIIKDKAEVVYLLESFIKDVVLERVKKTRDEVKKIKEQKTNEEQMLKRMLKKVDESVNELYNDIEKLLAITKTKKETIELKKEKMKSFKEIEELFNNALKKSKDGIVK